jgi:hypothetical protein
MAFKPHRSDDIILDLDPLFGAELHGGFLNVDQTGSPIEKGVTVPNQERSNFVAHGILPRLTVQNLCGMHHKPSLPSVDLAILDKPSGHVTIRHERSPRSSGPKALIEPAGGITTCIKVDVDHRTIIAGWHG